MKIILAKIENQKKEKELLNIYDEKIVNLKEI